MCTTQTECLRSLVDRDEIAVLPGTYDALSANIVEYGRTPLTAADELEAAGYDLVIFPNSLLRNAMVAMQETAEHIEREGETESILDRIASFEVRNDLTDYERVTELEEEYAE